MCENVTELSNCILQKNDSKCAAKLELGFKKCNLYFCSSFFGELAQLARALAWHARGHRFESGILHFRIFLILIYKSIALMYFFLLV